MSRILYAHNYLIRTNEANAHFSLRKQRESLRESPSGNVKACANHIVARVSPRYNRIALVEQSRKRSLTVGNENLTDRPTYNASFLRFSCGETRTFIFNWYRLAAAGQRLLTR